MAHSQLPILWKLNPHNEICLHHLRKVLQRILIAIIFHDVSLMNDTFWI